LLPQVRIDVGADSPNVDQRIRFLLGVGLRLLQHVPNARQHEREDHGISRTCAGDHRSVKSFDSLREFAADDQVTSHRKARAASTQPAIVRMSQIKAVIAPNEVAQLAVPLSLHPSGKVGQR
jgi:hypothetical protein